MRSTINVIGCCLLALPLCGMAEEAPVVDASSSGIVVNNNVTPSPSGAQSQLPAAPVVAAAVPESAPAIPEGPLTLNQVSKQVTYLQQLNLPSQIQQLQQQVQELRGTVETQSHQLEQLQNQLRSQYADLNSRLAPSSDASKSVSLQDLNAGKPVSPPANPISTVNPLNSSLASAAAAPNTANSSATASSATDSKETQAYTAAFDMIKNKKYSDAIQSFNDYLQKFPTGQYVANAHYWLGELYALSGANDRSNSELNLVVTNFPNSDKAPNAMLKLGDMAYNQSNFPQAKDWWSKIVKQYPNTSVERIANARLQQLEKAGQ